MTHSNDNNNRIDYSDDQSDDLIPKSIIYEDPEFTTRIEYDELKQKKWQYFSNKFRKGSMINSILSLFSFSPILLFFFIPFSLVSTGYIPFVFLLLFCSLLSWYTTHLLLKIKVEKKVVSLHQLLKQFIGNKVCFFYHMFHLIYMLGLSIMYLILSKNLFLMIANQREIDSSLFINIIFHVAGLLCFQIPSIFIRVNDKIRLIEMILMISVLLTGVFCSVDGIINFFNLTKFQYSFNYFYTQSNWAYGITIAVFFLTFSNQLNLYPELKELNLFTEKRGDFLISRTFIIQTIWNLLLGILCFAYFTGRNHFLILFESNIFFVERAPFVNFFYFFIFMFIILLIQYKISNTVIKLTEDLFETYFGLFGGYTDRLYPILILLLINISTYFIQNKMIIQIALIGVIGIIGGIVSSILCFILPIYCYNQLYYEFIPSSKKFLNISLIIISFGLGLISTISCINPLLLNR